MTYLKNMQIDASRPVTVLSGYRGLASHFIETFLRRGHQLSVLVRRPEALPELRERYPEVFFQHGDVSSEKSCEDWLRATLDRYGTVDCLINNAAVAGPGGKLHETAMNDIEETLRINLLGPICLCQQVLKQVFVPQKKGIVFNLSGGGATYPRPHFSAYALSKCALVRLTETLAVEYPDLRFYAISPGLMNTHLIEEVLKYGPDRIGKEYEESKRRLSETGGDDPKKAAEMVAWLFDNRPASLNGKLISSVWDDYRKAPNYPAQVGWWTLRRIDEICLKNLKSL